MHGHNRNLHRAALAVCIASSGCPGPGPRRLLESALNYQAPAAREQPGLIGYNQMLLDASDGIVDLARLVGDSGWFIHRGNVVGDHR